MTDEQTVTGKVVSLTEWKSKKGSWINLDDNPNDYFAYKSKVPKLGEESTWKVKEGSGIMADKVELVGPLKEPSLKEKIAAKTKEEVKEMKGLMDKGDNVYFERQNLIVRQCCIKAASMAVSNVLTRQNSTSWKDLSTDIKSLADDLYAWITESDLKLPEPPEEP